MRILVVEDEHHLSEAIVKLLQQHQYTVDAVYDGIDGYHYIISGLYDIVILDERLPRLNGVEILQKIQEDELDIAILMLVEEPYDNRPKDIWHIGADEYLTKPFTMDELVARVLMLSRHKNLMSDHHIIIIGDVEYDKQSGTLFRANTAAQLTQKEMQLLELLLSRLGTTTSKEQIIKQLWKNDKNIEDNNVEVLMSFLRKKIRLVSTNVQVKTTRNIGYSIVVKNKSK